MVQVEYDRNGPIVKAIEAAVEKHPRNNDPPFTYGTAGFRMKEDKLDYVMVSMGILAALRSRKMQEQAIGVMITASHNQYEDNGVKLIDPQGDMLDQQWEQFATLIANVVTPHDTSFTYAQLVGNIPVDVNKKATILMARDTRPSGLRLSQALRAGAEACGATVIDYGILTTPQLHYLVKATNTQNTSHPYGEVSEEGYYKKLAKAFVEALDDAKIQGDVTVDCANGVGAPKLKELIKHLPAAKEGGLKIQINNDNIDKPDMLNTKCGADYVKSNQCPPATFEGNNFERCASFDGDADRIVYYFNSDGPVFNLLDGDRIATLAASFIGELVSKAGLAEKIKLAVVQTAYANGASTKYIENYLKLKVVCTSTGVKHLHHEAAKADVGVYFEANGHGTVLFSPQSLKRIFNHEPESPAQADALTILKALTELINQTVGDAISDLLLVEVVLAHKSFSVKEWLATYTDMPNKLIKLNLPFARSFTTVEGSAERRLANPPLMQGKIDDIVAKYKDGRAFVRASGTENALRIYGEAAEAYAVDDMVAKVSSAVADYGDPTR